MVSLSAIPKWRKTAGAPYLAWLVIMFNALLVMGADKTAADYYVHSLPGQPDGPLLKMHAG